ncbi:hypothetical protein KIL84_015629 [Mauremys mutica]|uniref:Selenoprotein P N-terminal domain-containing protein n=1 Tax=Mauremys mutica TaxID=74926 RepID=A0A9D3WSP0_9SAUR|nr:hypothetical protein KIL84_015629 [Mauremys mutica]
MQDLVSASMSLTRLSLPRLRRVARMGLPALAVATLLGLVAATLAEVAENKTRLCQPAPRWEINGTAPMAGALGRVTVVALLKAS